MPYDQNDVVEDTPMAEKKEETKYEFTQWMTVDGKNFFPAGSTQRQLPPGVYSIEHNALKGITFVKESVSSDDLVRFVDCESDKIVEEMDRFWNAGDKYKKAGLMHKRGVLLYGRQGTGKTYIFRMVIEQVIARGGVCLKHTNNLYWLNQGIKELRKIQPDTPIVVLLEDIDAIIEDDDESMLINMLDGVDAVEHVVFLASTNHPEQLEGRVTNRPSRFDRQREVGALTEQNRRIYIEHLFNRGGFDKSMIDQVVKDTDGMAVDHVKAIVSSAFILGNPYEEALADVKAMKDELENEDGKESPGFKPNNANSALPAKEKALA